MLADIRIDPYIKISVLLSDSIASHSFHVFFHAVFSIFYASFKILYINTSISKILVAGLGYTSTTSSFMNSSFFDL